MSVSYTANIRDPKGNNDHRAELIFDYGLSSRLNCTFNASADYIDRKMALAGSFLFPALRSPLDLRYTPERRRSSRRPRQPEHHRAYCKLTEDVAFRKIVAEQVGIGFELPVEKLGVALNCTESELLPTFA